MKTIEAKVKIDSPVTAASCSVTRKHVNSVSGNYASDLDGEGGLAPFSVFCDMTDKNGVGVTVLSHDSEGRTYVKGYIGPESPHTVNSLSSTSVMLQGYLSTDMAGGCHVILLR